jgi:hypothetical protein
VDDGRPNAIDRTHHRARVRIEQLGVLDVVRQRVRSVGVVLNAVR